MSLSSCRTEGRAERSAVSPAEVEAIALADSTVVAQIEALKAQMGDGAAVKKVIVVPGRLVNIVVGK